MAKKLRHEQILLLLKSNGFVTVKELVTTLNYSSATINRDLNEMQKAGLVKRSYGGVEEAERSHLPPFVQRQFFMKKEKRMNAQAAAALIENGETVFLDASTTVQFMIPYLPGKSDICVITNSLRIAIELAEQHVNVFCLGGYVKEAPYVLGGSETIAQAMDFRVDKMFFSIDRISLDGRVGRGEDILHRVMMKNAKKVYLLTDRTKLVEPPEHSLCSFSSLSGVISDIEFPEETKRLYPEVEFICTK